jgi:hypothetical protein
VSATLIALLTMAVPTILAVMALGHLLAEKGKR